MSTLSEFFLVFVSAMIVQNAIFTRGLGTSRHAMMIESPRDILLFGGSLTVVTTLAGLLCWPLRQIMLFYGMYERLGLRYLLTFTALVCICVVFVTLYLLTQNFFPLLHYHLRRLLIPAAFNCATLGSVVLAFSGGYDLLNLPGFSTDAGTTYSLITTLAFVLGSGIGYTLAQLLLYEGRRRIRLSDVPRAFRGLPVLMLYVGIFSLAIYGLIGHRLPT